MAAASPRPARATISGAATSSPVACRKSRARPGPGQERLDAARLAAVAGRPRPLALARPRQRVVAPLAGDRVRPGQHLAVHHHAAARARPHDHAEDDARSRRRAVGRLGEREAVRVVREAHRPSEKAGEVAVEGLADQPGGVRVLDEAGGGREGARHPDADAAPTAGLRFEVADEAGHRLERRRVVVAGGRHPAPGELRPVVAERHALDLRAAEVEPDPHARGFSSFPPPGFNGSRAGAPDGLESAGSRR